MWSSIPDEFVQIIFIKPGHWACISDKFSSLGSVDLFDSLHTIPKEDGGIVQQVCTILHTTEQTVTINTVDVGLQNGFDDCGLFAIAMACDFCAGIDPITKEYSQCEMRNHLHSCFSNKQMKSFPSSIRQVTSRILFQVTVEVHCVCRMPELLESMVCCDVCGVWYHEGCVPIPKEVFLNQNDEVPWQCPQCEKGKVSTTFN